MKTQACEVWPGTASKLEAYKLAMHVCIATDLHLACNIMYNQPYMYVEPGEVTVLPCRSSSRTVPPGTALPKRMLWLQVWSREAQCIPEG